MKVKGADEPGYGSSGRTTLRQVDDLGAQISDLRSELATASKAKQALSDEDKKKMLIALKDQFSQKLVDEFEQRESDAIAEKLGLMPVRQALESSARRLSEELLALSRRGNLNLVIGTLTTLAAVGLLIYMVMGHDNKIDSITNLFSYYVPRISTVVFIEIFGFFFLRLYKSGLRGQLLTQHPLHTGPSRRERECSRANWCPGLVAPHPLVATEEQATARKLAHAVDQFLGDRYRWYRRADREEV